MTDTNETNETNETPVINRALFEQIRQWFTAFPEQHRNPGSWENCVGGEAIKIIGGKEDVFEGLDALRTSGRIPAEVNRCDCDMEGCVPDIAEVAGHLLGLTRAQGSRLFHASTADAQHQVRLYVDGRDPQEWDDYAASLGVQERVYA